jgi:hypothetical protein
MQKSKMSKYESRRVSGGASSDDHSAKLARLGAPRNPNALVSALRILSRTHFRVGLGLFVEDAAAPTVELSR